MIELCENKKCTGCLACYNACHHDAITLTHDEEGFIHPSINYDMCMECKRCVSACPIITPNHLRSYTPLKTLAVWAKDKNILRQSSSGGVFTMLSNYVLQNGGIVFGATLNSNKVVEHIFIEVKKDLYKLQGSKYVQSDIGKSYLKCKEFLNSKRLVLFTGTPCQIAGLLAFLDKKEFNNLITIDIVCHGVPTPLILREYITFFEYKEKSKAKTLKFRDKKWSWNRYNFVIEFQNGNIYYGPWELDPYLRGFLRNLFLRPSCHCCNYSHPLRHSDITLGDFWGFKSRKNEKLNYDKGVSLVLINTVKGEKTFNSITDAKVCYERKYEDAIRTQVALRKSFPANRLRSQFWKDHKKMEPSILMEKYCYPEKLPITKKIKYTVGHTVLYQMLIKCMAFVKHHIKNR